MLADYDDIIQRISEDPSWYDENGVPRYGAFSPDMVPNIYASFAALYLIACQCCGQTFHVSECWSERDLTAQTVRQHVPSLHYGDPPRHGCTGDSMNCLDIRVIEFWRKDNENRRWRRDASLEIKLEDHDMDEFS